jgi:CDP-glycerol glycerophosphotransferase (TagB/SpsB family)
MSLTIETLIHCNGCGKCWADSDCRNETGTKQRKEAKEAGWTCKARQDFCDTCSKLPPNTRKKTFIGRSSIYR